MGCLLLAARAPLCGLCPAPSQGESGVPACTCSRTHPACSVHSQDRSAWRRAELADVPAPRAGAPAAAQDAGAAAARSHARTPAARAGPAQVLRLRPQGSGRWWQRLRLAGACSSAQPRRRPAPSAASWSSPASLHAHQQQPPAAAEQGQPQAASSPGRRDQAPAAEEGSPQLVASSSPAGPAQAGQAALGLPEARRSAEPGCPASGSGSELGDCSHPGHQALQVRHVLHAALSGLGTSAQAVACMRRSCLASCSSSSSLLAGQELSRLRAQVCTEGRGPAPPGAGGRQPRAAAAGQADACGGPDQLPLACARRPAEAPAAQGGRRGAGPLLASAVPGLGVSRLTAPSAPCLCVSLQRAIQGQAAAGAAMRPRQPCNRRNGLHRGQDPHVGCLWSTCVQLGVSQYVLW